MASTIAGRERPLRPTHVIRAGRALKAAFHAHDVPAGIPIDISAAGDDVLINNQLGTARVLSRRSYERVTEFSVTIVPVDPDRDACVSLQITAPSAQIDMRIWDDDREGNAHDTVVIWSRQSEANPYGAHDLPDAYRQSGGGTAAGVRRLVVPRRECLEIGFRTPAVGSGDPVVIRTLGAPVEIQGQRNEAIVYANMLYENWYGGSFTLIPLDPSRDAMLELRFFARDRDTGNETRLSRLMWREDPLNPRMTRIPTVIGHTEEIRSPYAGKHPERAFHPRPNPGRISFAISTPSELGSDTKGAHMSAQMQCHARLVREREDGAGQVEYTLEVLLWNASRTDVVDVKEFALPGNEQTDFGYAQLTFEDCPPEGPFIQLLPVPTKQGEHYRYVLTGKFGAMELTTHDAISRSKADAQAFPPMPTDPGTTLPDAVGADDLAYLRAEIGEAADGEDGSVFDEPSEPMQDAFAEHDVQTHASFKSDLIASEEQEPMGAAPIDPESFAGQDLEDDPEKTAEIPVPFPPPSSDEAGKTAELPQRRPPRRAYRPGAGGRVSSHGAAQRIVGDDEDVPEPPSAEQALKDELETTQPIDSDSSGIQRSLPRKEREPFPEPPSTIEVDPSLMNGNGKKAAPESNEALERSFASSAFHETDETPTLTEADKAQRDDLLEKARLAEFAQDYEKANAYLETATGIDPAHEETQERVRVILEKQKALRTAEEEAFLGHALDEGHPDEEPVRLPEEVAQELDRGEQEEPDAAGSAQEAHPPPAVDLQPAEHPLSDWSFSAEENASEPPSGREQPGVIRRGLDTVETLMSERKREQAAAKADPMSEDTQELERPRRARWRNRIAAAAALLLLIGAVWWTWMQDWKPSGGDMVASADDAADAEYDDGEPGDAEPQHPGRGSEADEARGQEPEARTGTEPERAPDPASATLSCEYKRGLVHLDANEGPWVLLCGNRYYAADMNAYLRGADRGNAWKPEELTRLASP